MQILAKNTVFATRATSGRVSRPSKGAFIVRAEAKDGTPVAAQPLAEAPEAVASTPTPAFTGFVPPKPVSFGDAMAFSGPGPELINGRLAMLGVVAALGAEFSSNESVLAQFSEATPAVVLVAVLFSAASLIPILKGNKAESFGPFTPLAEKLNGQLAMIGLAALLSIEAIKGAALF